MNCEQANTTIDIFDLLERLGYKEDQKAGNAREAYFASPWRREIKASFCVNRNTREYFDHGLSVGGVSVIDFIVKYLEGHGKLAGISDALVFLGSLGYGGGGTKPLFLSEQQLTKITDFKNTESDLELIKVEPVRYSYIFDYLQSRGIPNRLVKKYLLQVSYHNAKQQKNYWGFGISNQSPDSYEIRSATKDGFKTALGKKDISIIKGRKEEGTLNVFEGFIDFLSLLVFQKVDILNHDSLILNSLSSMNKALIYIKEKKPTKCHLFLDNDDAGKKMSTRLIEELGMASDFSQCFAPYKDLNAALVADIAKERHFTFEL